MMCEYLRRNAFDPEVAILKCEGIRDGECKQSVCGIY